MLIAYAKSVLTLPTKKRKSNDPDLESDVDSIFEELEGTIDKHYDKIEAARKKQPKAEW